MHRFLGSAARHHLGRAQVVARFRVGHRSALISALRAPAPPTHAHLLAILAFKSEMIRGEAGSWNQLSLGTPFAACSCIEPFIHGRMIPGGDARSGLFGPERHHVIMPLDAHPRHGFPAVWLAGIHPGTPAGFSNTASNLGGFEAYRHRRTHTASTGVDVERRWWSCLTGSGRQARTKRRVTGDFPPRPRASPAISGLGSSGVDFGRRLERPLPECRRHRHRAPRQDHLTHPAPASRLTGTSTAASLKLDPVRSRDAESGLSSVIPMAEMAGSAPNACSGFMIQRRAAENSSHRSFSGASKARCRSQTVASSLGHRITGKVATPERIRTLSRRRSQAFLAARQRS